jgi:hypothetical protein
VWRGGVKKREGKQKLVGIRSVQVVPAGVFL